MKCRICEGDFYKEPIVFLKNMPKSAQGFLDYKSDAQTIDINVVQCKYCGTIQLDCEPVEYYKNVIRVGGETKSTSELRNTQFKKFIDKFNLYDKKILEVGCGRGEFLKILNEFNVECYGIENCNSNVDTAVSLGLNVIQDFLDFEYKILKYSPFDAFVQFNFLEHQPYPNIMMKAIYNNLTDDGVGFLTVPNCDYMIRNGAFYQIIPDHLIYFSKESFLFFLNKNGFEIVDYFLINNDNHGVFVKKKSKVKWNSFYETFNNINMKINSYIKNKKVAVWGAGHESLAILSSMNLSDKIDFVVDSSPFKQGKYSIGSNIRIISPIDLYKSDVDSIIIIAQHYLKEIYNLVLENMGKKISIATISDNDFIILN